MKKFDLLFAAFLSASMLTACAAENNTAENYSGTSAVIEAVAIAEKREETTLTPAEPTVPVTAVTVTGTETSAKVTAVTKPAAPVAASVETAAAPKRAYVPAPVVRPEVKTSGIEIPKGKGEEFYKELCSVLKNKGADAGFFYYDPQSGASIEYNADTKFFAASVIKAVYIRSILDKDLDLDAEYELTKDLLDNGSELIDERPVGTKYTVRELIEAALIKSSNTAYRMLHHYIGHDKFNKYAASLGLPQRMNENTIWFNMTARELSVYFKDIYDFTKKSGYGSFMLECMEKAELKSLFISALPNKTVAEKYGYLPEKDIYTLNACALVLGENDYILIMCTHGKGDVLDTASFQRAAKAVDGLHELIYSDESSETETTAPAVTVTETEISAEETAEKETEEITADIPEELINKYAEIIYGHISDMPKDEDKIYITFCDINNDTIPELFLTNDSGSAEYYTENGDLAGVLSCFADTPIYEINGEKYTGYPDPDGSSYKVTKIASGLPTVSVSVSHDAARNTDIFTVVYTENDGTPDKKEDIYESGSTEETDILSEELMGVKISEIFSSDDIKQVLKFADDLNVTDGENYTLKDIKERIGTDLEGYYALK